MRVPVPDEILPADRARPGALRRHRRRRAVRHRPDHARPRHHRQRQRRQDVAGPRRRCATLGVPRATSATTPSTSATPTRWWSRPPSARTTPRSSRRRARGLRLLPRSAGAGVGDGRAAGWSRSPAPTARPPPPRCSPSRCSAAGADPTYAIGGELDRDRAATPTTAAATCSWPRPTRATARSSSTARTRAVVTNVEADHLDNWGTEEAYHAAFDDVPRPDRPRRASWSCCVDDPGAARPGRAGARARA